MFDTVAGNLLMILVTITITLAVPIIVPLVCYYAFKAGRAGWLRAEQKFFSDTDNRKEK